MSYLLLASSASGPGAPPGLTFAGSQGHSELDAFNPVMADSFLQSVRLMAGAAVSFTDNCIADIGARTFRQRRLHVRLGGRVGKRSRIGRPSYASGGRAERKGSAMTNTNSDRRVVVTGAAGFIGFHFSHRLLSSGAPVLGLDNLNHYYDPALKKARLKQLEGFDSFVFELADIADHVRVRRVFDEFGPTHVVHLAAQAGVRYSLQNPRAYVSSNVDGFLSILEACRQVPVEHLIYASSSSVYGINNKVPFSENDRVDHPVSLYAATKRANELMAHSYAYLFDVPCTGLRFFTVYGPWGRPDMAYYSFTKAILEGQPIDVFNHGQMSRDFTYIDDIVEAMIRLLDHRPQGVDQGREERLASRTSVAPHAVYNIGNHTPVQLEHLIDVIARCAGRPVQKIYKPLQPGDVPATFADVSDLENAVGFAPNTPIEEGISRFVAWYREYHRA
jgi:UDP-glucuronate 4-epimerase